MHNGAKAVSTALTTLFITLEIRNEVFPESHCLSVQATVFNIYIDFLYIYLLHFFLL